MSKFAVGDRVVVTDSGSGVKKGYAGRVIKTRGSEICVEYDKHMGGHDCQGAGKYGHCWWSDAIYFKLEEQKFKVGDRVQFKSLEELRAERKEDECGGLQVKDGKKGYYFNSQMRDLCSTFATIENIRKDSLYGSIVELKDFTATCSTHWSYSIDMIKLAADEQPENPKKENKKVDNKSMLSTEERKILILIDKTYMARDIDGRLFAYKEKPVIDVGGKQFYSSQPYKEILQKELFNFIKFENSPMKIETLIKEE